MIGQFIVDEFRKPVFRLTKTTRPYFLQSRTLVLACRRLPQPPSGATVDQITKLRGLFNEVEHVLHLGTKAPRDHQTDTNDAFRRAHQHLDDYINNYGVTLTQLAPDIDEVTGQVIQPWKKVSKKDYIAGNWIREIKVLVGAKLESMKHIANLTLSISLWREIPRKWKNNEWLYASHNLEVKIEAVASLNVLLHRLFWEKAMDNGLPSFSLKQNPQFYRKFPTNKKDFSSSSPVSKSRSYLHYYIPALFVWDSVEKYKGDRPLHLILDRDASNRVVLKDLSDRPLPEIYGNGWHLDDDNDLIAVREKGGSHNLLLWNVRQLLVPSMNDSSTATLVEDPEVPGLTQGSTEEELNEEFGVSAVTFPEVVTMPTPSPMPAQVGFPNYSDPSTAYANYPHHRSPEDGPTSRPGQDLTPAVPHPHSLVNDRTPALQKVQPPNTSSSRMSQISTEDSSSAGKVPTYLRTGQIPSPPSVHQETQPSIQAQKLPSTSPFSAASIPADISNSKSAFKSIPSPRPGLTPTQNLSSRIPGDPSPASNSFKLVDSSVPVKPASLDSSATTMENDPGQRLNQEAIQVTTGSLSTSNIQPPSSSEVPLPSVSPPRRGRVVIQQPEAPTFDPHFAPGSTSMQTVGTETKAKKGGFRGWIKGTLENFVAR